MPIVRRLRIEKVLRYIASLSQVYTSYVQVYTNRAPARLKGTPVRHSLSGSFAFANECLSEFN